MLLASEREPCSVFELRGGKEQENFCSEQVKLPFSYTYCNIGFQNASVTTQFNQED